MAKRLPTMLQAFGKWFYDFGRNLRQTMEIVGDVRKTQKDAKKARKADQK